MHSFLEKTSSLFSKLRLGVALRVQLSTSQHLGNMSLETNELDSRLAASLIALKD